MTTPPIFPTLPGKGWSVKVTPTTSTRVAQHVSGREVRVGLFANPLYAFELTYDGLDSRGEHPGLVKHSLQTLLGFWLACGGQLAPFLYIDPEMNVVGNGVIGTGDGSTSSFTASRVIGGFSEPVGWVTSLGVVTVAGVRVYGAGVVTPNTIALPAAPAVGAIITATFSYAYLCRFTDDTQDFEEFMAGLWSVDSLKFRAIR